MSEREHRSHDAAAAQSLETSAPAGGGPLQQLVDRFGPAAAQRIVQRRLAQRRAAAQGESPAQVHAAAAAGTRGTAGPLPHLDAIQRSFGRHDVGQVRAHTDDDAAAGAAAMGAEAYASGDRIAFAAAAPSLHTAAHEAAHVVQQRAGVQLAGGVGQGGDAHEQHADRVADLVVQGRSAEALLDQYVGGGSGGGGGVQRKILNSVGDVMSEPQVALLLKRFRQSSYFVALQRQQGISADEIEAKLHEIQSGSGAEHEVRATKDDSGAVSDATLRALQQRVAGLLAGFRPLGLAQAKKGDQVRAVGGDGARPLTVLEVNADQLTLKGGLTDKPFTVHRHSDQYQLVPSAPAAVNDEVPSAPPPVPQAPSAPPLRTGGPPSLSLPQPPSARSVKSWETKWDRLKRELDLSDSEIAAMQAYTTSTYAWLNGFLRQGDNVNPDMKQQIVNWLVNTGVIGQLSNSDPKFHATLLELIDAEARKDASLAEKWSRATPVLTRLIELIVSGMKKWPQPDDEVVSRGVDLKSKRVPEFVRQMHAEGSIASDPGFMSTTFGQPFAKDSIVVARLPADHAGRNIAEISKFEQEAEILFPPGSGYTVERVLAKSKPQDAVEFEHILAKLVPSAEERQGRFAVVDTIYLGAMVAPR